MNLEDTPQREFLEATGMIFWSPIRKRKLCAKSASATVRKFLVGYELLAEPQHDPAPERAAAMLRSRAEPR